MTIVGTPQAGVELAATLADPDGGVSVGSWSWSRAGTRDGVFSVISGATGESYTPGAADVGMFLRAAASYSDAFGPGRTASGTAESAVARSVPVFSAADYPDGAAARSVAENAASGAVVGVAVTATDVDGDTLTYSVAETTESDAAADLAAFSRDFSIDSASGQISVNAAAMIDFETRHSYKVLYRVSDGVDAAGDPDNAIDDMVTLTVTVTNVDEADDTVGLVVPRTGLSLAEGATGAYTVALATEPSADVTVTVSGQAGTDVSLSGLTNNRLTFTTGNWDTSQTVTVTAAHDSDAADDEVTLTHTAASTDADYEGLSLGMAVTVDDDDTVGLVVSRTGLSLPEESVLVSNRGQSGERRVSYVSDHGQAFTTGNNSNGYIFSSVTIISEDPDGDAIVLQICGVDGGGAPTEACTGLTPPDSFARGTVGLHRSGRFAARARARDHLYGGVRGPGCRGSAGGRHQQRRGGLHLPSRLVDSKQIPGESQNPVEHLNRLARRQQRQRYSHRHQRHSCGAAGGDRRCDWHLHGGVGDGTVGGCNGDGVGAGGNGRVVVRVDEQRVDVHHRQLGHIADGDGGCCS